MKPNEAGPSLRGSFWSYVPPVKVILRFKKIDLPYYVCNIHHSASVSEKKYSLECNNLHGSKFPSGIHIYEVSASYVFHSHVGAHCPDLGFG